MPTSMFPERFNSSARPRVNRPIRMAPSPVLAVTLPSARSTSKPPLPLLRSRSAEAWPIQICPPELESPTVPLISLIRTATTLPWMLACPAMWPIATSPAAMFACSALMRSSWTRPLAMCSSHSPSEPSA